MRRIARRTVHRIASRTALFGALVFAPVVLTPTRVAAAQSPSTMATLPQAQLDVIKVLLAQERAWNAGDLNGFLSGYKSSPDTTFIGESVQHGFSNLAAHYHKDYPNREAMGELTFSDLQPRLLDERVAVITGHYHLERGRKAGGNADGIFSLVLEKSDEGWKIVLDHTS